MKQGEQEGRKENNDDKIWKEGSKKKKVEIKKNCEKIKGIR